MNSILSILILITISLNSFTSENSIYHPREHTFSIFDKFYEEKNKPDNNFIIVHIKNNRLVETLWASKKANLEKLSPGATLYSFFDEKNSFPLGNYHDLIAILYSNGSDKYLRRDDGSDSDSFIYDDRVVLKKGLYQPIYGSEIFKGAQTGLNKNMIKKIINGNVQNRPRAIRCSKFFGEDSELSPILFQDEKLILPPIYLGNGEEIKASYNDHQIVLNYKMKGEAPDDLYYTLPDEGDISYNAGYYIGRIIISYDSTLFRDIKFPHNTLFQNTDPARASERFKKAFTSSYYPFLNPRVCSFEREFIF